MITTSLHERKYVEAKFEILRRYVFLLSNEYDELISRGTYVNREDQERAKTYLLDVEGTHKFLLNEFYGPEPISSLGLKWSVEEMDNANLMWHDLYQLFRERKILSND